MSGIALGTAVLGIGASYLGAKAQTGAAEGATAAQVESADKGIAEQRRQFDAIQELLAPYVGAGVSGIEGQQNLIGLGGPEAQQAAIAGIEGSPEFGSLVQQGENAILQNASATGGLRGGNTQASLAQFRPQILSQLINQQYGRLGGLSSLGQNAAAGVGNAGLQTGRDVANLYGQQGTAQAQGSLYAGNVNANLYGDIAKSLSTFAGSGVF